MRAVEVLGAKLATRLFGNQLEEPKNPHDTSPTCLSTDTTYPYHCCSYYYRLITTPSPTAALLLPAAPAPALALWLLLLLLSCGTLIDVQLCLVFSQCTRPMSYLRMTLQSLQPLTGRVKSTLDISTRTKRNQPPGHSPLRGTSCIGKNHPVHVDTL